MVVNYPMTPGGAQECEAHLRALVEEKRANGGLSETGQAELDAVLDCKTRMLRFFAERLNIPLDLKKGEWVEAAVMGGRVYAQIRGEFRVTETTCCYHVMALDGVNHAASPFEIRKLNDLEVLAIEAGR